MVPNTYESFSGVPFDVFGVRPTPETRPGENRVDRSLKTRRQ